LLFASLAGRGAGERLVVGAVAGAGLYGPGLWWMREFHVVGYLAAAVLEAAVLAGGLALVPPGRGRAVAFPAVLVLVEALRAAWPWGGVPLAGLDLAQVDGPLAPAARLGGRLVLVALVGAAGVGLALAARRRYMAAGAVLTLVLLVAAGGVLAPEGAPGPRLVVAAVQRGGTRGIRAVDRPPNFFPAAELEVSSRVGAGVDVVLWPESAVDVDGSAAADAVAGLARRLRATVVAGVIEDAGPGRFANAAVAWDPAGRRVARYDKVHRVPFGEYIPARALLERLADVSAVPKDAVAGRGPGVLDTPVGRLGAMISYEVFFPERARAAVQAGARVLLVPTNASSYRDAQVPAQEVTAARLRALETGRWVVQAAPTGYSAVVDPRGRVVARGGLGGAAVVQHPVELRTGTTLAVRLGTAPLVAVAAAGLLGAWLARRSVGLRLRHRRHNRREEATPPPAGHGVAAAPRPGWGS
jgi:apolipoprotein N-acyltransferase